MEVVHEKNNTLVTIKVLSPTQEVEIADEAVQALQEIAMRYGTNLGAELEEVLIDDGFMIDVEDSERKFVITHACKD